MRQQFIDDVKGGDLISVRLALANELMLDPRGGSFEEMLRFAAANMNNLYESDDNKSFSQNEADWNKELLYDVKNELDYNFSRSKLDLYKKIIQVVLREKMQKMDSEKKSKESQSIFDTVGATSQQPKSKIEDKVLTYGGAAVAILGVFVPHPFAKIIMIGAGVAAVVAGQKKQLKNSK